ncbi:MAG TPA: nucleotidyltransferase family protein, partial [Thermoanaerobaculaceae bacterium]|nr:nucleotidyltransferase family protein [Thermoanaerobaculaceae bacterium]
MSSDSSLAPETQWVLARAFLPPDSSIDLPPDLGAIWPEATRLRMAPRIASRCGAARLARELGNQQAQLFATASRRAAVDAMRVAAQLRYLARTADRLGLRFAVLKGAAFHEAHLCLPGARPLADCDILCPRRDAVRLFEALLDDGWIQEVGWRTDYHLPPLHKDGALPLEIHDAIPLVVTKGRLWATYEDLEQCKSLDVTPGAGALVSVEFLRAHAIAHAVAQPERMTARTIA